MIKALDYFASLVQDDEQIPLFEAALSIALDVEREVSAYLLSITLINLATWLRPRGSETARVSALVPARDEAANIEACVRALLARHVRHHAAVAVVHAHQHKVGERPPHQTA